MFSPALEVILNVAFREAISRGHAYLTLERLGGVNSASRGFHETLTEFWILEVRSHLAEHGAGLESIRLLTQLPAGLWKKYYTIDLPKSRVARRQYIPHA